MMEYSSLLPTFDVLYAVSDIHMGGDKSTEHNFQIFNRGKRLAALIRQIKEHPAEERVALVLNGDIIDSLAERDLDGYVALDSSKALAMLNRIYNDPSFAPVWEALGELVRTRNRTLVLVVGNHDIELAVPPAQASIRNRLAAGDVDVNARIVFATDGGGFACHVGESRVFCTHGNETDYWNMVDYSALGQLANAMNAGRVPDPSRWTPNAGTRLVVDVMNEVKRKYPFVDLLKPETKPVLSTLMTLDAKLARKIEGREVFGVAAGILQGKRAKGRLLSAEEAVAGETPITSTEIFGPRLSAAVGSKIAGENEDALLSQAHDAMIRGESPLDAFDAADDSALGGWDLVRSKLGLIEPREGLRLALLDWLENDETFSVDRLSDSDKELAARIGPQVDFLITGHSHLARHAVLPSGQTYFNCGTWVRLLRLTTGLLEDKAEFSKVYDIFALGRMDALDQAEIPGPGGSQPLLLDRTTAVRIAKETVGARGALLWVYDTDDGKIRVVESEAST